VDLYFKVPKYIKTNIRTSTLMTQHKIGFLGGYLMVSAIITTVLISGFFIGLSKIASIKPGFIFE